MGATRRRRSDFEGKTDPTPCSGSLAQQMHQKCSNRKQIMKRTKRNARRKQTIQESKPKHWKSNAWHMGNQKYRHSGLRQIWNAAFKVISNQIHSRCVFNIYMDLSCALRMHGLFVMQCIRLLGIHWFGSLAQRKVKIGQVLVGCKHNDDIFYISIACTVFTLFPSIWLYIICLGELEHVIQCFVLRSV